MAIAKIITKSLKTFSTKPNTYLKLLGKIISQYINVISYSINRRLLLHATVLLYSCINQLGYICCSSSTDSDIFIKWCNKYLLPNLQFPGFNEEDLWAARCGILHKNSPISKNSKKNKARELIYFLEQNKKFVVTFTIEPTAITQIKYPINPVLVDFNKLFRAFKLGIKNQFEDLKKIDSNKEAERIREVMNELFVAYHK